MTGSIHDQPDCGHHLLFARLILLLTRSQLAYDIYLQRRILLNALRLRSVNRRIVRLLHTQAGWIPPALMADAATLVNHYECWLIHFSQHLRQLRPALDELFVFPTIDPQNAFPKDAVARIAMYARSLSDATLRG